MVARRIFQLFWGLTLYGIGLALMVRADLGLMPWDVFHQGVSDRTGLSFGTIVIATGIVILLAWIPMRQKPGIGTLANIFIIGLVIDLVLWLLPPVAGLPVRWAMMIGGLLMSGIAGGAYIGAGLGPGPRDGMMTGIADRTGWSIRLVRTGIEVAAFGTGWLLGGTVGLGTILYAVLIGPMIHRTLPLFTIPPAKKDAVEVAEIAESCEGI
ncbi:membrane protein YczE [Sphingosinicella rhizophila]|uniref:Membrane protein YczE n=1 Tax=Sphingosinicella rhizophila TaxID=3050082 RepID=A0ABU3QBL4_9SPHN|nr:hypothetical protein [Sphingosinicella sp. GR2756]MDT9600795.1 hypothetical protein [Sphingosinicella sp. GR2756]